MPLIRVTTSPLTTEQKKEMVRQMTEVTMEVLGAPEQAHIVLIDELPIDALGMGKLTVAEMVESKMNHVAE
ncbi:tautomerase family protein [Oceanirhabdus seepicola]|uniref:Tautomerase family protein n=1 Tax=Oceanirhabdus seepicola TaxID=2828781 RepID=A0A9J6P6R0_9CLOT|nr:tautomerase family protein [Oceanirhabdus seepicola]MCM1991192.1 tautomerase family protein [Oceanirhabdus seepicola]